MKYLLTGGYGCIGSWIAKTLVEKGQSVAVYDLVENTKRMALIMPESQIARIRFVQGDVQDGARLREVVGAQKVTHIIHLAGLQIPVCRSYPVKGGMVNVIGTVNVFEAAKAHREQVQRIVFASSGAAFGPPEVYPPGPLPSDSPLKSLTHYGVYKQCNEGNARVYYHEDSISSIGLRPWTVYGPGRDFGLTSDPTKAIKAALLGRAFTIQYGGRTNMQFVDDVAKAFIRCNEAPFTGAKTYNLRGALVHVDEIITTIEKIIPSAESLITHTENEIPCAIDLDDSDLQEEIGDLQSTSLEEGIGKTVEIFQGLRDEGHLDASELES